MISKPTIKYEISDGCVAIITLSRPAVANTLSSQMAVELNDIFSNLSNDIRAVILTGDGEKAFCAGADLKERYNMDVASWQVQHQQFRHVINSIMSCQIPVIAAVNGAAYGGGLEIALACDFIYSTKTANFALPEATLGIMPGMGGTQNLPRSVGLRRAKELLLTGKSFSAQDAYDWGLVNKICEPASLMNETLACAKNIAANAPLSIKAIRLVINQSSEFSLEDGLFNESSHYNHLIATSDCMEGISAFNEKRKPKFFGN